MNTKVDIVYRPDRTTKYSRPLFITRVPAGFPSPAADYEEGRIDLNKHLIRNPAATFFVRVTGDSMIGAGIHSDDLLVVDRSLEPRDKNVVIAVIDGELTVKRIRIRTGRIVLESENANYAARTIEEGTDFQVWGVVTNVIHSL